MNRIYDMNIPENSYFSYSKHFRQIYFYSDSIRQNRIKEAQINDSTFLLGRIVSLPSTTFIVPEKFCQIGYVIVNLLTKKRF